MRLCRLRRTGLHVPRLRRTIYLPSRSLRRSGCFSLWLDVVHGREWRHYRSTFSRFCGVRGEHRSIHIAAACDFFLGRHAVHARACGRAGADCHPHLRQRRRTALGRAPPEHLHLDEVHGHGSLRCPRIRHRQGTLVEFQCTSAGRLDHGIEPRTIDLRSRDRIDRRLLRLRRLGLHHVGRRRSQRPAAECSAGHGSRRTRGRRDLSRHEPDLRLCLAAE